MISPGLPDNEPERIAALKTYDILDTPEEEIFDQITSAAAEICKTPISLLTLVDGNRQWFKSRHGFALRETGREISFCAHAILGREILTVEDAELDVRTEQNPLVTGDPYIRSYAGKSLITDEGYALGTLCVIDTVPRKLTAEQTSALERLAASATRLLAIRKKYKGAVFAKAVDAVADGIVIADATAPGCPIVYVNPTFVRMTGIAFHATVGQSFYFPMRPEQASQFEKLRDSATTATFDLPIRLISGDEFWDRVSFVPYLEPSGQLVCLLLIHRDVTVEKELEAERHKTEAMRTTIMTVKHTILNFMNAVQLYRSQSGSASAVDRKLGALLDEAMDRSRAQLTRIGQMEAFRDKPTPFGFSILDE